MFAALLPLLGGIGNQIAKNLFPDPADETKRQEIETQFQAQIVANAAEIEKAAAGIINTEAASKHWLAANWRPLTMLIFVGLIVSSPRRCISRRGFFMSPRRSAGPSV